MSLSLESLFSIKLKVTELEIPEYGTVFLREMTGKQRDDFESLGVKANKTSDYRGLRARLIISSLCDKDGNLLLGIKDESKLNDIPARLVNLLASEIMKINGIGNEGIEEAEKNLVNETRG